MDYYDSEGNKIEGVVTKEEHEKELQKVASEAILNAQKDGKIVTKEEHDKVTNKITELETNLKKASDDLAAAGNKDQNFAALREKAEKAEKDLADFKSGFGNKLADIEKQLPGNNIDAGIKQLAGNDVEMEKKIRFQYDRISNSNDTIEDKRQKLIDAATLAKGTRPAPNLINGVLSGAGGADFSHMKDLGDETRLKPEVTELAKRLGISDKDVDKFGKKSLNTQ